LISIVGSARWPYRLRGERLEVIAVFHGRQRWPKRL
jgi:plasmid stabilization system protein ParE